MMHTHGTDKTKESRHTLDPMYTFVDTNSCTIITHTHIHTHVRTVQYHPLSSLYLSPDSSLHSLAPLSVKKKKKADKNERVFFQPLSTLFHSPPGASSPKLTLQCVSSSLLQICL